MRFRESILIAETLKFPVRTLCKKSNNNCFTQYNLDYKIEIGDPFTLPTKS